MKRPTTRLLLADNGGQPTYSKAVQDAAERITDSKVIGPGWWLFLHLLARSADKFATSNVGKIYKKVFFYMVMFTVKYFKALECKNHFADFVNARPPEKESSLFVWSVDGHNEVNKRNGKKIYTVKEAALAISGEHDPKIFGMGAWAILHQTAYQAMLEQQYQEDARNIHIYMASREEFGHYYKLDDKSMTASLFSYSVMKHTECGGMKLTIPEASYIWGPENVREEPCSGPAPAQKEAVEEEESETVYDIVSDEESESDDDSNIPFFNLGFMGKFLNFGQ